MRLSQIEIAESKAPKAEGMVRDGNSEDDQGRNSFYSSPQFSQAAVELFGDGAAETLDLMVRKSAFPGSSKPSVDMIAHEAGLVLAAMATRAAQPPSVPDAARAVLAMEYQLEYGPDATSDRKGLRDERQPPQKDFFGTQLASGFRKIAQAGNAKRTHRPFAVTIGWTRQGECIGLIHHARNETTFVYSTAHLLRNTQPGIVRLNSMEFDLPAKFEASERVIERFGRLMFGKDDGDRRAAAVRAPRWSLDG